MHYFLLSDVCILVNHTFVSLVRKADFTFFQRMPEGNTLVGLFPQTVESWICATLSISESSCC